MKNKLSTNILIIIASAAIIVGVIALYMCIWETDPSIHRKLAGTSFTSIILGVLIIGCLGMKKAMDLQDEDGKKDD